MPVLCNNICLCGTMKSLLNSILKLLIAWNLLSVPLTLLFQRLIISSALLWRFIIKIGAIAIHRRCCYCNCHHHYSTVAVENDFGYFVAVIAEYGMDSACNSLHSYCSYYDCLDRVQIHDHNHHHDRRNIHCNRHHYSCCCSYFDSFSVHYWTIHHRYSDNDRQIVLSHNHCCPCFSFRLLLSFDIFILLPGCNDCCPLEGNCYAKERENNWR